MDAKAYELLFPSFILIFAFAAILAYIYLGAGLLFYASALAAIIIAVYFTKMAGKSQEMPKGKYKGRKSKAKK